jgi:hypothetical protein
MSTVQAWLSVVNQLTELGKLHEEYRQHVDTQQTEAALLVMNPVRFMRALGAHISSNALQLAKASCGSAECEEIVSKVRQPRVLRCRPA